MKSVWSYGSQQESFSSEPVGKGIFPKASTGPTGYQPRGLPEAVRPDQITEAVAGIDWPTAIETGMKMPAYTLERPLALADTIAQGLGVIDQDKGILDPIAEGLRGLPIVGEHLDNLGKLTEGALDLSYTAPGSIVNADWASIIRRNAGKPDDTPIFAPLMGPTTFGEVKEKLRGRGWTDADFRAILEEEKDIYAFGDKPIDENPIIDMGLRMALDPTNLLFAPGLVTKAAKLTAAGLSKMTSSSLRYTAKLTSVPALGVRAGAAALEAGETAGVTAPAFASYLTNLARGGKTIQTALQTKRAIPYASKLGKTTPAGWYRRTAVATTAGQVAINTADRMTPQDSVVRDWLEPIYDAAAAMGERKPLSENQLFVISSLLFYPWRSSAEGIIQKGRDVRAGRRLFDHENAILDKMLSDADYAKLNRLTDRASARRHIIERFGNEASFHAWAQQIVKTGYFEKLWLQNLGKAAPAYAAESLAEVGMLTPLWNQWFEHSIERAMKYGELTGEDAAKGLERFVAGRGGVTPGVTSGVEYANFSAERAIQAWLDWEPIARRISQTFPNGAPIAAGVNQDAIIKEGIDFMLAMVDNATVDGMLRAGELMRITYTMPAIFQHQAAGNLARIMTRDGSNAQLVAKEVKEALALVRDDAIDMADYFAPQRSWEARAVAGEIKSRVTNRMWHSSGKMADDINPNLGNAEVTVMTQSRKNSIAAGFLPNAEYIEIARILRNDLGVAVLDSALPNAAQTAGLDVLSAVQVALLDRSSTKAATLSANTGIAMRFAENTPFDEMVAVAARGLEQSGAERAMVVLRGEDIIKARGLVANADEITFVVPRLKNQAAQDAQWDELTKLFQQFDDRVVMNDTTGLIRVIIPKNAPKRIENVLAQAEKRLGAGTRDSVHIRDIVNRKVRKSDPAGTISLRDAQRQAAQNQKYHVMGGYLGRYERLFARNRGINVAAEPGAGVGANAPARVGNPDRTAPGARPTRYERERRNGRIRERTEEHVVVGPDADKLVRTEWGNAIRASGLDVRVNPGDRVFATADRANGALVKRDGELVVWRKRDSAGRLAPKPDDFDDVISAASEHATWAHVLDVRDKRGLSPIDHLAEHGWGPTAKSVNGEGETIVWLVRDPSGQVVNIPSKRMHGVGGWQAMQDSIPTVRVQQGRAQAKAQMLDPEAAQRQLEAARQNTLLERVRELDRLDAEIAAIEARTTKPKSSSIYREKVAQRDELERLTSTTAAKARKDALLESEVRNPGNFTFVKNTEDELREVVPYLDESVDGNLAVFPPGEAEKIVALERELKSTGWQYTVKAVPRHAATPYYVKQGEAYVRMMQGRQLAHDVVDNVVLSKLSQAQQILFKPVYAKELRRAYQQELYNEALNLGATPREVNAFLKALEKRWEETTGPLGVKLRKSPSALSPKLINDIAYGRHTVDYWKGFSPKVLAKNPDFADMVQRASSRNFRELAKKYPAVDGQGNLGRLIEEWYGKQTGTALADVGKATRRGMYYLSFGYHILRFVLDPRWYAMNMYEADFLGMARYGMKVKGQRPLGLREEISRMRGREVTPKAFPQDPAIQKLGGQRGPMLSVEESLMADSISSGWMDVRNLYGYIAKSSALERGRITKKMLQEAIDGGSPVIQDLRSLWGDNPSKWVDELEDQLYRIDTVGARQAILSEPVAQQMLASNAPATKAYQEFIEGLVRQHQKSYQDIVHTFHGNVNRANIERIFNSPLLYWPLSYQLKTGKWLIDIMTKSFAGSSSELLGSAVLYKLMANHNQAMENNAEYRKMFDEHPALWRAFGMFLPMTPFDPGVMLARWTRYAGSWTGAQLGLWDQDPSYPQDVFNFVQRGLSLGPVYSSSIIEDIIDEFNREK